MEIDWARIVIVAAILIAAIATNVTVNLKFKHLADAFPFIRVAVWIAIFLCVPIRKPPFGTSRSLISSAFSVMLLLLGWHPHERERPQQISPPSARNAATETKTSVPADVLPAAGGLAALAKCHAARPPDAPDSTAIPLGALSL